MNNKLNQQLPYSSSDEEAEQRYLKYKSKDPFPKIFPALLNSADIADYVAQTGMIYPFDPSRLGPASYEMVLGGEYLYWDEQGKKFSSAEIKVGEKLILRENSITYVSVRQIFRIPDYIALRFNLRVKHVHRGLLLGTGPLIDPGFHGKLMIPIHNLTSNEYTIQYGEDLISVEFTKISPNIAWENDPGKEISEEEVIGRTGEYVQNSGKNSKKTFEQLLKNILPIGVGKVVSSLSGTLASANKKIRQLSRFQRYSLGAGIAVFVALLSMFYTVHSLISDANKYVSDAAMLVKKYEKEDVDIRNFVARKELDALKSDVSQLSSELAQIRKKIKIEVDIDSFAKRSEVDAVIKEIDLLKEKIGRLKVIPQNGHQDKK